MTLKSIDVRHSKTYHSLNNTWLITEVIFINDWTISYSTLSIHHLGFDVTNMHSRKALREGATKDHNRIIGRVPKRRKMRLSLLVKLSTVKLSPPGELSAADILYYYYFAPNVTCQSINFQDALGLLCIDIVKYKSHNNWHFDANF